MPETVEAHRARRGVPAASGASAGRPTSSLASFGRSLRALAELGLPELSRVREAVDPAKLADHAAQEDLVVPAQRLPTERVVASGQAPAFALPGVTVAEPAYAQAVDWMLCAALADLERPGRDSYYFRLTPRPLDQAPFDAARERLGDAVLRRQVLTGAYRLVEGGQGTRPRVQLAAVGPTLPEVLAAARLLERDGVSAHVVDVTCPDAVYAAWQRGVQHALRASATPPVVGVLRQAFDLTAPLVAVHDRSGESLTWLGSALGLALVPVSITCRPDEHTEEMVVSAALAALSL